MDNWRSCLILLHSATVILLHLVKRSETGTSHSLLHSEVEVNSVESNEMADTISDVLKAYIRDLFAPSK